MAKIQEPGYDLPLKAYPNELTPDIDTDYTVKVDTQETSLTLEHIALRVANRLNREYNDVLGALNAACEETAAYAASGYCISTPLFRLRPVASGVLMEEELSQPVDREKIKVYGSFSQGDVLREAFDKANVKLFLQPAPTGPYIAGMVSASPVDPETQTRAPMQAGRMAVLQVRNGKIVGDDPSVGITLTKADDPDTSFFIGPADISPNTASKLQFILPAGVTDGQWLVKITTQYASGGITKKPRTFELERPVTIGATATTPDEDDDDGSGTFG